MQMWIQYMKRAQETNETNYKPVSILLNLSKVYGQCMFDEITEYFDDILSKYQCGFRERRL